MVSLPTRLKDEPQSVSSEAFEDAVIPSPCSDTEKGWEFIVQNDEETCQNETNETESQTVQLNVHPLNDPNGILLSITPPKEPPASLGGRKRYPVDIVLVLDVSSSMDKTVKVPQAGAAQAAGGSLADSKSDPEQEGYHTRLDLAKNAIRGIVAGLDERDRVGIVTFAYNAHVFKPLTRMTKEAQESLLAEIDDIKAYGATNLWAGLRQGYKMLTSAATRLTEGLPDYFLPAVYLLTDGLPNVMAPPEGYVPALRRLMKSGPNQAKNPVVPTIHTFGFGYELRSGLLQSLAEVGGGYYAFIPDGSFVATIFNHAFANLNITFTTSAKLRVIVAGASEVPLPLDGAAIYKEEDGTLEISLYNLQYGQQRNIFLTRPNESNPANLSSATITACLDYTEPSSMSKQIRSVHKGSDTSGSPSPSFAYYHLHRALVCEFLASLSHANTVDEYMPITSDELDDALTRLNTLTERIKSSGHTDELNKSILRDLRSDLDLSRRSADDPAGQIQKALSKADWFEKWGAHYRQYRKRAPPPTQAPTTNSPVHPVPSILHAYRHQLCLNEKDPGPKTLIAHNALFDHFKQRQSDAWDTVEDRLARLLHTNDTNSSSPSSLPASHPPHAGAPPTYAASRGAPHGHHPPARITMAAYNNPDNPCFAGPSRIQLASGRRIPVSRLRAGMRVRTPAGPRRVAAVMRTAPTTSPVALCRLGQLLVTPWHPVLHERTGTWVFPAQVVADLDVCGRGGGRRRVDVYSVLLEERGGGGPAAHAVRVGGWWCVTLGHGVMERRAGDARGHEFFGDYGRVVWEMRKLRKGRGGVLRCGGMRRDERTGLACGFEKLTVKGSRSFEKSRNRSMMV